MNFFRTTKGLQLLWVLLELDCEKCPTDTDLKAFSPENHSASLGRKRKAALGKNDILHVNDVVIG